MKIKLNQQPYFHIHSAHIQHRWHIPSQRCNFKTKKKGIGTEVDNTCLLKASCK